MSLIVDIKKDFGSFQLDVAFEADEGITCLLGASGCGKSVTLKCIAGLITPDSGYIELDGQVLYDSKKKICLPPQQRHVGYLFQNYALFPHMTVKQNLLCGMRKGMDRREREEKYGQMLRLLELEGLEKRYPGQLSGGQAQRVALGRILLNEPKMLILDEPLSALDTYLKDKLMPELRRLLKSFPYGVLMVTHSREEAYRLADHGAVIDRGKVNNVRPIKKMFSDPGTVQAALLTGCKNIAKVEKCGEYEVYVPEWKIRLKTAKPVSDSVTAIGVRAHYFHPDCPQNQFPIVYADSMEEPFEWIMEFRFKEQEESTPSLWWRLAKSERPKKLPEILGIAPANIMLLEG